MAWERWLSLLELHSLLVPNAGARLHCLLDASSSTSSRTMCLLSLPFRSSHSPLSSPSSQPWVCPTSQQQGDDKAEEAGETDSSLGSWRTHFTVLSLLFLFDYMGRREQVLMTITLQLSTENVGISGTVTVGTLSSCPPLCPILSTL